MLLKVHKSNGISNKIVIFSWEPASHWKCLTSIVLDLSGSKTGCGLKWRDGLGLGGGPKEINLKRKLTVRIFSHLLSKNCK